MRSLFVLLAILSVPLLAYSGSTSIYDIQYTANSGFDGTYPSPLRGQIVTVSGIVTAIDSINDGFYISESEGGPWRGIYISDNRREVIVADSVILTGEVYESFGFTGIRNVRQLKVESRNNPLPPPVAVSTGELAVSEAYEGVLVKFSNVTATGHSRHRNVWLINDGSGACRVVNGFLSDRIEVKSLITNELYSKIIGVVDYRYGEYRVNLRSPNDIMKAPLGIDKPSWGKIKSLYR
jgi:predicted extracellular nuclease